MKLIRFGEPGRERPGLILPDGRRIDASGFAGGGGGADYDEAFFGSGGLERLARWLADVGGAAPVVATDVRLGPPICRPSKIVCVGLNYRDHARESGMAVPDQSEEHTSELQSHHDLVCRLLLEKKKKTTKKTTKL